MKNITKKYLILLTIICIQLLDLPEGYCQIAQFRIISEAERRVLYNMEDFINYSDMRFISSVSLGNVYTYFGTQHGIIRINNFTGKFESPYTRCSGLLSDNIFYTIFDKNSNILWAISDKAVSYYREGAKWWENIRLNSTNDKIENVGEGDRYIWIKRSTDIHRFDKISPRSVYTSAGDYKSDNVKWKKANNEKQSYPFFNSPFNYMYFTEGRLQDNYARNFPFTDFVVDKMNNLMWIGTWGLGPVLGDLFMSNLKIYSTGPSGSSIKTIYKDKDIFWIGGYGKDRLHGITKWDSKKNEWEYYEPYTNPRIRSSNINFIKGNKTNIFFASDDGLVIFDKSRKTWKTLTTHNNLPSNLITFLEIFNNEIWIGTDLGPALMILPDFQISKINVSPLKNYHIYNILADENNVWCATEFGIYLLDRNSKKWSLLDGAPGMLQIGNKALYKNIDELWSVSDGGLQMFSLDTKEWLSYPKNMYFHDIEFNFILVNDNNLWCATDKGLIKHDRQFGQWKIYTENDGLPSDRIFQIFLDGDFLWLATDQGLVKFYWNNPIHRDSY